MAVVTCSRAFLAHAASSPLDVVTSAHALEHVPDDAATLDAIRTRIAPHGVLVLWVPIEEPDYISFHLRAYSMQSIAGQRRADHVLHRLGVGPRQALVVARPR